MKTIRQIADEIGVSKQAVQKRMSREPLYTHIQKHITLNGNTMYIDETGERLIKSAFDETETPTIYTDVHNIYTIIRILEEQLIRKDKQIEELIAVIKTQAESIKYCGSMKPHNSNDPQRVRVKTRSVPIQRLINYAFTNEEVEKEKTKYPDRTL